MIDLKEVKDFTLPLVEKAGKILMEGFDRVEVVKQKDRQDICTNLDMEVEDLIVKAIQRKYPDHHIFTEESGELGPSSGYTWVIDPLDGTKHYVRHLPIFNISIALQYKNELVFGTSFWPAYNDLYWGGKGLGSFLEEQKIYPSKIDDLGDAFMYADFPNSSKCNSKQTDWSFDILNVLSRSCYRTRFFADAHAGLCWVASGGFDGYMGHIPRLNQYWDIAAGCVILKEAGGMISDLKGKEVKNPRDLANGFIASNGKIHQQLVDLVASTER